MAAASIAKLLGRNLEVTLIESDAIPTVGVGEATIPSLLTLHQLLGIDEQEFMRATQATFKLGISFENWRDVAKDYIHSFGWTGKDCWAAGFQHFWLKAMRQGIAEPFGQYCPELVAAQQGRFVVSPREGLNYAYHLDAGLYAKFLRRMAEDHGAVRQEGTIEQVVLDEHSGFINKLVLRSGLEVEGDLFIDCTGFGGLLIEKTLHAGYDDWTHWLPCDRAVAVQTRSVGAPVPYTRSIARESGWQWRIPLQHRVGNGLVFCSRYWSEDEAVATLLANVQGDTLTEPRVIPFRTGQRREHWKKNCVSLGLASGFIEPLESTSIHLIQRGIIRLLQMFPHDGIRAPDIVEFNEQMAHECNNIRDFIILHYHVTERTDTPFWRHCRNMDIPDSLQHRIDLFRETGRVFKVPNELFGENSWIQVMLGQGLLPEQYHPIVDQMGEDELERFLSDIRGAIGKRVGQMPTHEKFIDYYCRAEDVASSVPRAVA
jgi:tryptophan halogenase